MPLKDAKFTVRILSENPHRKGTDNWRAGRIIEAMEGCEVPSIIDALTLFEENRIVGVADPARWLAHFAGLENSPAKAIEPWIEIIYRGNVVNSTTQYRHLVKGGQ